LASNWLGRKAAPAVFERHRFFFFPSFLFFRRVLSFSRLRRVGGLEKTAAPGRFLPSFFSHLSPFVRWIAEGQNQASSSNFFSLHLFFFSDGRPWSQTAAFGVLRGLFFSFSPFFFAIYGPGKRKRTAPPFFFSWGFSLLSPPGRDQPELREGLADPRPPLFFLFFSLVLLPPGPGQDGNGLRGLPFPGSSLFFFAGDGGKNSYQLFSFFFSSSSLFFLSRREAKGKVRLTFFFQAFPSLAVVGRGAWNGPELFSFFPKLSL